MAALRVVEELHNGVSAVVASVKGVRVVLAQIVAYLICHQIAAVRHEVIVLAVDSNKVWKIALDVIADIFAVLWRYPEIGTADIILIRRDHVRLSHFRDNGGIYIVDGAARIGKCFHQLRNVEAALHARLV